MKRLMSLVSLLSLAAFALDVPPTDFDSATNGWTLLCRARTSATPGGIVFSSGRLDKRSVNTRWAFALVSEGAGRVALVNWWPRAVRYKRLVVADVPTATTALHLYALVKSPGDGGKVALFVDGRKCGEADGFQQSPDCNGIALKALPWGGDSVGLKPADDAEVALIKFYPRAVSAAQLAVAARKLPPDPLNTPVPPSARRDVLRFAAPLTAETLAWPDPASCQEDVRQRVTVADGAALSVRRLELGARDDSRLVVEQGGGRLAADEVVFGQGAVGYALGGGKTRTVLSAGRVRGDGFGADARKFVVKRNGRLELGSGGWVTENDSWAPGERRLVLAGGTLAAAAKTRLKTVLPVVVKGEATIEAKETVVCDCEFEGEGTLTVTGRGGIVIRKPSFAPVTLRVQKGSRVILAAPWNGPVVCEEGAKVIRRD